MNLASPNGTVFIFDFLRRLRPPPLLLLDPVEVSSAAAVLLSPEAPASAGRRVMGRLTPDAARNSARTKIRASVKKFGREYLPRSSVDFLRQRSSGQTHDSRVFALTLYVIYSRRRSTSGVNAPVELLKKMNDNFSSAINTIIHISLRILRS